MQIYFLFLTPPSTPKSSFQTKQSQLTASIFTSICPAKTAECLRSEPDTKTPQPAMCTSTSHSTSKRKSNGFTFRKNSTSGVVSTKSPTRSLSTQLISSWRDRSLSTLQNSSMDSQPTSSTRASSCSPTAKNCLLSPKRSGSRRLKSQPKNPSTRKSRKSLKRSTNVPNSKKYTSAPSGHLMKLKATSS